MQKKVPMFFKLIIGAAIFISLHSVAWCEEGHSHGTKHKMVLFGEKEVFASHIVYKVPHNFQVIIKIIMDDADKEKYIAAKAANPSAQFIYVLNPMNIGEIASASEISGSVVFVGEDDHQNEVIPNVKISRSHFEIIYLDELPLSLASADVPKKK